MVFNVRVPTQKLLVSDLNVRASVEMDPKFEDEFVPNVGTYGVLQPIEARPLDVRVLDAGRPIYEGKASKMPANVRKLIEAGGPRAPKVDVVTYEVTDGRRRTLAAQRCLSLGGAFAEKNKTVPAVVYDVTELDDAEAALHSFILNEQREDMDPLTRAKGVETLLQMRRGDKLVFPTMDALAKALGKSAPTVAGWRSLLRLKGKAKDALATKRIGKRVAEDIAQFTDDEAEQELLLTLLEGRLVADANRLMGIVRQDPSLLKRVGDMEGFKREVEARLASNGVALPKPLPQVSVQEAKPEVTSDAPAAPQVESPTAPSESKGRNEPRSPRSRESASSENDEARALEHVARQEREALGLQPTSDAGVVITYGGDAVVRVGGEAFRFDQAVLGLKDFVLVPRALVSDGDVPKEAWHESLLARVRDAARKQSNTVTKP